MRAAPPVGVRCTGGRAWRFVQVALTALAAGVSVGWIGLHAGLPVASSAAAGALAAGVAGAWVWRRTVPVSVALQWDGAAWSVDALPGEQAATRICGALDVMLDLGGWMLLRERPVVGHARWIPVSRADAGPAWHALRVAVHARRGADSPRVIVAERAAD